MKLRLDGQRKFKEKIIELSKFKPNTMSVEGKEIYKNKRTNVK